MGYDKHSLAGLCLPMIFVLIAGVYAFEKIDETMYLFLVSHFVPPPSCPENELWHSCLQDCSDCARRGKCRVDGCARKGCDCRQNFVRLTPGGACVPVHECPKPECGENESFRECGPVCEGCGGLRCRLLQCEHRCYCDEGHFRDPGGKCIPKDQCPPSGHCHRDEEQKTSGRKNEYCLRDEDEEPSNATETRDRCYCKEGFSRSTMGICVAEQYCSMSHCLPGETYQSCPRKCNATCRGYGDASCAEDGHCFPGCFCEEGRYADDVGRCVALDHCPPGSNPFAPTASPTTTPAMTSSDATPSTENDASGSNPTTAQVSGLTVDSTPRLSTDEEDVGSSDTASTTEATSQASAQTSTVSEVDDQPKDTAADKSTKIASTDQDEASSKATVQVQEDDQDEDEDEFREEIQKGTTTEKPKSLKKPGKEKKQSSKAKKATTPVDMDDMDAENE